VLGGLLGLEHAPLFVDLVLRIILALAGGLAVMAGDRRRRDDEALTHLLVVELRFILAAAFMSMGFAKVLHVEMPWPSFADWIRPIREMSSPHFVEVWMGSSSLYQSAMGFVELATGALLVFRRSATLGALLVIGLATNSAAVLVGFSDVRAGTYWPAVDLIAMAAFIVLTDYRKVLQVFRVDTPEVSPSAQSPRWPPGLPPGMEGFAKGAFAAILLLVNFPTVIRAYDATADVPLAGIYTVERFTANGSDSLPEEERGLRWRLIAIDDCRRFAVRTLDDRHLEGAIKLPKVSRTSYTRTCARETEARSGALTLVQPDTSDSGSVIVPLEGTLKYTRVSADTLDLEAALAGTSISIRAVRVPERYFQLTRYPGWPEW
jgi:hypothetical protein